MLNINHCHQSVFLIEAIQALNINPAGFYIDGTFGEGGHTKLILSRLNTQGRLLAVDRDQHAINIGKFIANEDRRVMVLHSPFSKIYECIQSMGAVGSVDGILLDLGICTSQLINPNRGFSFMRDGPLDMRMDISTGQTAAEWLSKASQKKIEWVLKKFGEERFAKKIARVIVEKRRQKPILRSCMLSKLIKNAVPYCNFYKHPATRSFLAIRMYINKELEEIIQILNDSLIMLSARGRLVVISFNSLEDRLVKKFIRQNSCITFLPSKLPLTDNEIFSKYQYKCQLKNIGKLKPSAEAIKKNVRARSAILRCAEKICL